MVAIVPSPAGRGSAREGASLGDPADRRDFARFVTELFSKRRKQIGTIFGRERSNWPSGITPQQRPEVLDVDQLILLWKWSGIGARDD